MTRPRTLRCGPWACEAHASEIAGLPDKWLHRPWEAPADVLEAVGLELGEGYPTPMVDHAKARASALAAFEQIKQR